MEAVLEYWDRTRETKVTESGFRYEDSNSYLIREEVITGNSEIELFEAFYKKNNQLRYCNGSYYVFKHDDWKNKYSEWLKSDDYKSKSFSLYYGGGIVD